MSREKDAWEVLLPTGLLGEDTLYSPSKSREGFYSKLLKQHRAENPEPDPDFKAVPEFEKIWAELEHHAAKLSKTDWSLMKATSSLGAKASDLGITRLTTRDLQQLLDDAARKSRATAQPIGEGGIFRVKNTPWVVNGIFRHGLNLLTAPPGAGKSRLCAALAGAWINGKTEFMGKQLLGSDPELNANPDP